MYSAFRMRLINQAQVLPSLVLSSPFLRQESTYISYVSSSFLHANFLLLCCLSFKEGGFFPLTPYIVEPYMYDNIQLFNPIITDGTLFIRITKSMMRICWTNSFSVRNLFKFLKYFIFAIDKCFEIYYDYNQILYICNEKEE